eukprot:gene723-1393_t
MVQVGANEYVLLVGMCTQTDQQKLNRHREDSAVK